MPQPRVCREQVQDSPAGVRAWPLRPRGLCDAAVAIAPCGKSLIVLVPAEGLEPPTY